MKTFVPALVAFSLTCGLPCLAQNVVDHAVDLSRSCRFADGLKVVDVTPSKHLMTRDVKTASGAVTVTVQDGARVMFAYPDEDFFANVKIEGVAPADWAQTAKAMIDSTEFLASSSPGVLLGKLDGKSLNGFSVYGIDRQKREGGVLSIYLLLRANDHLAVTAYVLNQDPPTHFQTIEEFARLRDGFLQTYSACLAAH